MSNPYDSYQPVNVTQADVVRESGAMSQVYAWMMAGLLVTGAIGAWVASSPLYDLLIASPPIFSIPIGFIVLFLAQIGLVIWLSAGISRMSPGMATGLFLLYSALMGLTLSTIFEILEFDSIALTFFITGGMFGITSAIGYFTKVDLTRFGGFLIMALVGFVLGTIVNLFLQSTFFYWLLTYAGIAIFIGLTAWDTQKIKNMLAHHAGDQTNISRVTIIGALMLYLDFINLFLLLLRIFGDRR